MGGDDWFEATDEALVDAALTMDPALLARALLTGIQNRGLKHSAWPVLRAVTGPFVTPSLESTLRRLTNRRLTPRWIGPEFARRIGLEERLRAGRFTRAPGSLDAQAIIAQSSGAGPLQSMEAGDYLAAGVIEERNPYCDRRIVEFAIALPFEQRRRGTQSRIVLREAVRGFLPERARLRTSSAEFNAPAWARVKRALTSELGGDPFSRYHVVRNGWVREQDLELHLAAAGVRPHTAVWPLWMTAAVEIWYRATQ
jgi:hypothetical protein